jgi:chromate transport protein ChrA
MGFLTSSSIKSSSPFVRPFLAQPAQRCFTVFISCAMDCFLPFWHFCYGGNEFLALPFSLVSLLSRYLHSLNQQQSQVLILSSLPGALAMYGLSLGVSHISESLPRAVYAFLSGLNAAVVGIILLAAVQLSEKAITDKMTRSLVFFGGTAGVLYTAVWYLPILMLAAGLTTVAWDLGGERWIKGRINAVKRVLKRREDNPGVEEAGGAIEMEDRAAAATEAGTSEGGGGRTSTPRASVGSRRSLTPQPAPLETQTPSEKPPLSELPVVESDSLDSPRVIPPDRKINISWQKGTAIITGFFVSFVIIMVLRGTLPYPPLLYRLFANMYLAGTIIFGGGPVVIPLLREYVVAEGWLSPRDFLLGLAIIQAFPGPNFNFAVYLGSLTAINGGYNSFLGALIGFLGIFAPGLLIVHGGMGLWSAARSRRWVRSGLRGINAAAVGLIYTAVYRIWQVGYLDKGFEQGQSLGEDPWWVVVTATSYVGGYWYGLNPPSAIVLGAVMGLIRYGVIMS